MYHDEKPKQKENYFISSVYVFSCFMIGFSVLLLANANEYKTYTVGEVERETPRIEYKHPTAPTTREPTSRTDWESKEEPKGWTKPILRVKGFPKDSDATHIINYAYEISSWNMEFVRTLKAENWAFDIYLQSYVPDPRWPNGREDSWGLCQLHRSRHSDIVDQKIFRESRAYQVEICREKYRTWTKFYGRNVQYRYKDLFYWE